MVSHTHKYEELQKGMDRNMKVRQIFSPRAEGEKEGGYFLDFDSPQGKSFVWPPRSIGNGGGRESAHAPNPFLLLQLRNFKKTKKQTNRKPAETLSEAVGVYFHLNLCGGKASSRLAEPCYLIRPIKEICCETSPLFNPLPQDPAEETRLAQYTTKEERRGVFENESAFNRRPAKDSILSVCLHIQNQISFETLTIEW